MAGSVNGSGDNFPPGQCTYWASFRYHQLTGFYVPFSGNANQWAGNAPNYGWIVSTKPVAPSIICLQAGIQGADGQDGHVGVVEAVNADNSVATSDLNWGLTSSERALVSHVTFKPGPGVSFIYAVKGSSNQPVQSNSQAGSNFVSGVTSAINQVHLAPDANVASFLAALDTALTLTNPFQNVNALDPISYLGDVLANSVNDLAALTVRSVCILLGFLAIYLVLQEFVLKGVNETLQPVGGISGVARMIA